MPMFANVGGSLQEKAKSEAREHKELLTNTLQDECQNTNSELREVCDANNCGLRIIPVLILRPFDLPIVLSANGGRENHKVG